MPTLAMPQLFATGGDYPQRGGGGAPQFTLAMVQGFAGSVEAFGAPRAEGQYYPVAQNQALYSIIGPAFGSDGESSFAIPDLNGRSVIGGEPIGEMAPGALVMEYLIAGPGAVAPLPGMVMAFAGGFVPDGWWVCDGSLLAIGPNVALFSVIGSVFGGNGSVDFALPNLNGSGVIGVGEAPGQAPVALGETVPGPVPGLGLNYLIATEGELPAPGGDGGFPDDGPFIGQVLAFAGGFVPQGWALCDGSLLAIAQDTALFQVIGTAYGGDGTTSFALPDLRGRMIVGQPG